MASDEEPPLCASGCGFFGNPETQGLCSKCYRDHKEKAALMSTFSLIKEFDAMHVRETLSPVKVGKPASSAPSCSEDGDAMQPQQERCNRSQCKKKVGLAKGFKCKCGGIYCSGHRYPEEHDCTYDFKGAGKQAIATANPVVKDSKIQRI